MNVFSELTGQDSFTGWPSRSTGWFDGDPKSVIMSQKIE